MLIFLTEKNTLILTKNFLEANFFSPVSLFRRVSISVSDEFRRLLLSSWVSDVEADKDIVVSIFIQTRHLCWTPFFHRKRWVWTSWSWPSSWCVWPCLFNHKKLAKIPTIDDASFFVIFFERNYN